MNEFLLALPWRIASFAALLVGIVTFAYGGADVWDGLLRVGIAFVLFYIVGAAIKSLLVLGNSAVKKAETSDFEHEFSPSYASEPYHLDDVIQGVDSDESNHSNL